MDKSNDKMKDEDRSWKWHRPSQGLFPFVGFPYSPTGYGASDHYSSYYAYEPHRRRKIPFVFSEPICVSFQVFSLDLSDNY